MASLTAQVEKLPIIGQDHPHRVIQPLLGVAIGVEQHGLAAQGLGQAARDGRQIQQPVGDMQA